MKKNFQIPQGTDWSERFVVKNKDGTTMDFSGISFSRAKMKLSYGLTEGTTIGVSFADGGTTGVMILNIGATTTSNIDWGYYVYDVETISITGATRRPLEGRIDLTPEVS